MCTSMRPLLLVLLAGCSSSAGTDAGSDAAVATDSGDAACAAPEASCDVSSVAPSALLCGDWVQRTAAGNSVSCPGDTGSWKLTADINAGCIYTWTGSGTPDVCALPSKNGASGISWLEPACDAGCP